MFHRQTIKGKTSHLVLRHLLLYSSTHFNSAHKPLWGQQPLFSSGFVLKWISTSESAIWNVFMKSANILKATLFRSPNTRLVITIKPGHRNHIRLCNHNISHISAKREKKKKKMKNEKKNLTLTLVKLNCKCCWMTSYLWLLFIHVTTILL